MNVIESLLDLANNIGFEAIDNEISSWIESGEFDDAVVKRAESLGWVAPNTPYSELDEPLGVFR